VQCKYAISPSLFGGRRSRRNQSAEPLWGEVDRNELIRVNSEVKRPRMPRRNSLIKFPACLYFSERNLNGSKMAPSINGSSVFIAEFESWLSGFPQSPALIVESSSRRPEREAVFSTLDAHPARYQLSLALMDLDQSPDQKLRPPSGRSNSTKAVPGFAPDQRSHVFRYSTNRSA